MPNDGQNPGYFVKTSRTDVFTTIQNKIDQIQTNNNSIQDLTNFAPNFVNWIHESNAEITEAFTELVTYIGKTSNIPNETTHPGYTPTTGDWLVVEFGFEYGSDPIIHFASLFFSKNWPFLLARRFNTDRNIYPLRTWGSPDNIHPDIYQFHDFFV